MRLRELYDRVERSNDRYWELDKSHRIAVGLRHEVGEMGYSGDRVINFCRELLSRAFRGLYPIETGPLAMFVRQGLASTYPDIHAVVDVVDSLIVELEGKLDAAYTGLASKAE